VVLGFLLLLLFASAARAQSSDWRAVQNLRPGTHITVKTQKSYACKLEQATEDKLVCQHPSRVSRRTRTFQKAEIREVRLAVDFKRHAAAGAAIGAAVGAIVGASVPTNVEQTRFITAIATGFVGAGIGHLTGGAIAIVKRGKVIYKP
jgi:hypothetical protein